MSEPLAVNLQQETQFPAETEIYILPDGQVVIADLPAELAEVLAVLLPLPTLPSSSPSLPIPAAAETAAIVDHDAA